MVRVIAVRRRVGRRGECMVCWLVMMWRMWFFSNLSVGDAGNSRMVIDNSGSFYGHGHGAFIHPFSGEIPGGVVMFPETLHSRLLMCHNQSESDQIETSIAHKGIKRW